MFQKIHLPTNLLFGAIAAIAYCIPMFYFVHTSSYSESWVLYLGNFLFMIAIGAYMAVLNRRKAENANTHLAVFSGHVTTVIGIVISCIVCFIALSIYVPGLLSSDTTGKVLEQSPAQAQNGRTEGLVLLLFMNAIIGNVSAGSFVSIIMPYTMKRNQTRERVIGGVTMDPR
jgi:heme/copper-type cytochrome/quinol oxidase subunit 2